MGEVEGGDGGEGWGDVRKFHIRSVVFADCYDGKGGYRSRNAMVLAVCYCGRGMKGWVYEPECDQCNGGDNVGKSGSFKHG